MFRVSSRKRQPNPTHRRLSTPNHRRGFTSASYTSHPIAGIQPRPKKKKKKYTLLLFFFFFNFGLYLVYKFLEYADYLYIHTRMHNALSHIKTRTAAAIIIETHQSRYFLKTGMNILARIDISLSLLLQSPPLFKILGTRGDKGVFINVGRKSRESTSFLPIPLLPHLSAILIYSFYRFNKLIDMYTFIYKV